MSWYKKAQSNDLAEIKAQLDHLLEISRANTTLAIDFTSKVNMEQFDEYSALKRQVLDLHYKLSHLTGVVNGKMMLNGTIPAGGTPQPQPGTQV